MSLIALTMIAATVNASPSMAGMDPLQRDAQCLVALRAEPRADTHRAAAVSYFENRIRKIEDPELRELLVISAEEAILSNTNRSEIAETCDLLHQVLAMQEKQAAR
jgi:hypothetical protein